MPFTNREQRRGPRVSGPGPPRFHPSKASQESTEPRGTRGATDSLLSTPPPHRSHIPWAQQLPHVVPRVTETRGAQGSLLSAGRAEVQGQERRSEGGSRRTVQAGAPCPPRLGGAQEGSGPTVRGDTSRHLLGAGVGVWREQAPCRASRPWAQKQPPLLRAGVLCTEAGPGRQPDSPRPPRPL